jgi:hypothetical protein
LLPSAVRSSDSCHISHTASSPDSTIFDARIEIAAITHAGGATAEGVPEVFVTSPTSMNVAGFSRTFGHWSSSAKALERLNITAESVAVIANLGEQARSDLGSGTRRGTEQIMIGMRSEKPLDALSIEAKLPPFDRKKHVHQT